MVANGKTASSEETKPLSVFQSVNSLFIRSEGEIVASMVVCPNPFSESLSNQVRTQSR
jgi:hypothetical protein